MTSTPTTIINSNLSSFRSDINGLRAWAVMSVVLYHFKVPYITGGFLGVDIFFVISGYLMTRIIVRGLETEKNGNSNFSILNFYAARAKRIIPALWVLCSVLLIVAWSYLSSIEYKTLADHTISALGFFSNAKFAREAGYFDAVSHEKILLHTWSLSVEWQFYILLPLVLVLIWKIRPSRSLVTWMLALGLAISLTLSIIFSSLKPSLSFYLLPTRAWEMMAGGMVFLLSSHFLYTDKQKRYLEAFGFLIIIGGLLVFTSSDTWPGWRALVPVTGAVFILIAGLQNSVWTNTKLAQWLGNCSYSIYLWHWPIVFILVYLDIQHSPAAIFTGIMVSLLLGQLSYSLVENPARHYLSKISLKPSVLVFAFALTCLIIPCMVIVMKDGVPSRFPAEINAVFMETNDRNPRISECHASGNSKVPECTYGGKELGAIVIGDSHAASIVRTVEKSLPNKNLNVLDWTHESCRTIAGVKRVSDRVNNCEEFLEWALKKQLSLPPSVPLIIMNRTSIESQGTNEEGYPASMPDIYFDKPLKTRTPEYYAKLKEGIVSTACQFAETRPVYMVRPTPELKRNVPKTVGRAMLLGKHVDLFISLQEYKDRHSFVWDAQDEASKRCGVKILNPLPYLCANDRCEGVVGGIPLYYDDDHLSEHGANLLIPMFQQVFEKDK